MKNDLLKKFFSFSIGGYINIIIGLLTVPVTTRMLSPEQYGIFSLINTIVNVIAAICYLGLDQGFIRFFYDENEENRGKLLFESLLFPFVCSIIFSFGILFFQEKISIFILGREEVIICKILILLIITVIINRFALLVIRMKQRGKLYSFLNVLIKIIEFFSVLILYKFYGNSYKTMVFPFFISLFIVNFLSIFFERKMWLFTGKLKTSKKELLCYSFPLSLAIALNWFFVSSDKIMIKFFSTINELGLYSGALKIISLLTIVQTGFTTFWTPVAYEHYTNDPNDTIFFKKAADYLAIVFFGLGVGILITRNIIILLLGEKYHESIFIMPFLVFIPVMYLLSEVTMVGINFKKQTKYTFYIAVVVLFINFIGNMILVSYLGAKGAAISTGLSYILFFTLRTYFSNKLMKFGFDLKRIYLIIILLFIYALVLSFYNDICFNVLTGIILEMIILYIYFNPIKEVYIKYIKKNIKNIKAKLFFIFLTVLIFSNNFYITLHKLITIS